MAKKSKNLIVKMNNNFSKHRLDVHSKIGLDVLMGVLSQVKHNTKGEYVLELSFKELKELSSKQKVSNSYLLQVVRQLITTTATYKFTESHNRIVTLFSSADVFDDTETAIFPLNEKFLELFQMDKNSEFTVIEMNEYTVLKSRYSKELYRKLKQFKTTGLFRIRGYELLSYLNPPKGKEVNYFHRKIIAPAVVELSNIFNNLHVEYEVEHGELPDYYTFYFDKMLKKDNNKDGDYLDDDDFFSMPELTTVEDRSQRY